MQENHYRSVVKGITWRIIGTLDTIFLSWLFTRKLGLALTIGGIEVFTKIFLFYLHERIWLKSDFGREKIKLSNGLYLKKDKHYRSAIKGISWRIFGTLDTMMIAFFVTGNYTKALSIGFAEVFTKILLYYLHERVWMNVKFGTETQKLKLLSLRYSQIRRWIQLRNRAKAVFQLKSA